MNGLGPSHARNSELETERAISGDQRVIMDVERHSTVESAGEGDPAQSIEGSDQELVELAAQTERLGFETRWRKDMVAAALFDEPVAPLEVGRYTIVRELGVGGMGIVYVAYDEQLDRRVAVKLLRPDTDARASLRLQREAQTMARLSHPNVVTVHEVGTHRGRVFVAMEFVEGQDLRRWSKIQRRTTREVLAAFVQAGEGLVAAHDVGIVHRDFKPDNVLVGNDGRLRVADFGLAHALVGDSLDTTPSQPSGPLDATLTKTGALVGTPAYMAPEQFRGAETDARSDQFSFCVALWEALYGRRPFAGKTMASLSRAVLAGQISEPARSEVPPWLRKILVRGLAVDPEQRWPSMRSLLAALQRDPTRRRRTLMVFAGLLVLAFATIGGLGLARAQSERATIAACELAGQAIDEDWNEAVAAELEQGFAASGLEFAPAAWTPARARMAEYAQAWSSQRTQVCLEARVEHTRSAESHDRIVECLDRRRAAFAGLLDAWASPDRKIVARAVKAAATLTPSETCLADAEADARARPPESLQAEVAELRVRLEGVRAFELAGRYERGLSRAEAVETDALALDWLPIQAEAALAVGKLQSRLGHYEQAIDSYRRSFRAAVGGGDDLGALLASIQLTSDTGFYLAQPEESRYWATLGSMLIARLGLAGTLHAASLLNAIGVVHFAQGDYAGALDHYVRALAIKEHTLGADHLELAASLSNIGIVYFEIGDDELALVQFRRALAIQEAMLGPDHLDVAGTLVNESIALYRLREFDAATTDLLRALVIQESVLGRDHVDVATTLTNLGNVRFEEGELDEALELQRRALAIQEATLGPDHSDVAITLNNIADVRVQQGAELEAIDLYERALAIQAATLGPDHPALAYPLTGLGEAELSLGRLASARARLERAEALRESGGEAADLAQTRFLLARVLLAAGDPLAARVRAEAAREGFVAAGPGSELDLAEVEFWLREARLGEVDSATPP
ncbi:tetratricopeptide repeat protein [Nannocystaceae bacterium ST9]